ncbi:peptidylprolyl isomerase [Pelagibacterales bacterium SAG-MED30]|nr:peptidylprolyl isomerase [Pelagibacterales bacterium SAG-MED30]
MIKKIQLILIFCLLLIIFLNNDLYASIIIKVKVNDEIITNIDLEKEAEYLKILNPGLNQLNNNKVLELAKISLVNEIIKEKEIIKFVDINKNNEFVEEYLKNLYSKLNYNSEKEFINELDSKDNYSINEIKEKIKLELLWNELIYNKYNQQVKIDKKKLIEKINNIKNENQKEYLLSEIIFKKKKDESLENLFNQIKLSINDIGFNNTANIYSISESSKFGGKLGWVNENSLSNLISDKLSMLKETEYTDLIKIGNSYLLLKIDQIKVSEIKIDKQKELNKLIQLETNKQLNQFSRIYFNKSKINYSINEN